MNEKPNDELEADVALALGWTRSLRPRARTGTWVRLGRGEEPWFVASPLPAFATSLDAHFRPGGTVEYALAKGWEPSIGLDAGTWVAEMYQGAAQDAALAVDGSPARALCLAFLEAVKAAP